MGEVINLKQARKRLARAQREAEAAASRARHGRTAAEKQAEARQAERLRAAQDGARLDPDPAER